MLLGVRDTFPEESVVPYPLQVKVHGKLMQEDASGWTAENHPYLEARWNLEKVEAEGDPRDVTFKLRSTYTIRNVEAFAGPTAHEMWGPSGYQALRYEEGDTEVTVQRAGAEEPPVQPPPA